MLDDDKERAARDPLVYHVTNFFSLLFSYMGGIGRTTYWLGFAIVVALLSLSLFVLAQISNPSGPGDAGFAVPPLILAFWIFSALLVKRLRDAGFSTWQYCVFVGGPVLLIVASFELMVPPLILLGLLALIAIPGFYPGRRSRSA